MFIQVLLCCLNSFLRSGCINWLRWFTWHHSIISLPILQTAEEPFFFSKPVVVLKSHDNFFQLMCMCVFFSKTLTWFKIQKIQRGLMFSFFICLPSNPFQKQRKTYYQFPFKDPSWKSHNSTYISLGKIESPGHTSHKRRKIQSFH